MIYIRNMIGRNHVKVAKYYYFPHAYVAVLNCARLVVFKFQGASTVLDTLI